MESIPSLPRYRVLFVCLGNICRSPAAEGVARHVAKAWSGPGPAPEFDSAGTIGYHRGAPPDHRMRAAARRRGIPLDGASRPLEPEDFQRFDLILTMDEENRRDVLAAAPDAAARAKVLPMVAFSRMSPPPAKVPDPYYGGDDGFELVLDILSDACSHLVDSLARKQCP